MNFFQRWRHGVEREQEQLLVRLWTMNTLDNDANPQPARLTLQAQKELKYSLKYLSIPEIERTIERTVTESAYNHRVLHNLRRQIHHRR